MTENATHTHAKFMRYLYFLCGFLLLGIIILMPQMISHAQQDRNLKLAGPTPSKAEQRVALIIGNGAYAQGSLANPVNDARDMAAALRSVGFEVLSGENVNQTQMKRLIRDFGQKIRNGGVGLFYFAGHGVQANNRNYLIPVGVEINSEAEVEYEAVESGFVLAQMEEARNRLHRHPGCLPQ